MNNDIISRQAAIDALGEEPFVWNEDDAGEVAERNQWKQDITAIKALPSAERHGRWIIDKYLSNIGTCSICGDQWGNINDMRYCPTCGAKMDGEQNE